MYKIKFGIDGWQGIIAKDFTVENVARFATAIATWITKKEKSPSAVLGYDTRFGGEMFLETIAKVLAVKGVKTYIPEDFVTSPMVSVGVHKLDASCGVMITASHNTAEFNGVKIKNKRGGAITLADIRDIETFIDQGNEVDHEIVSWNAMIHQQLIQYVDLESIYLKAVHDVFDLTRLNDIDDNFIIDVMYGSAQRIVKKIFPNAQIIHNEINPTFKGMSPDPNSKNLVELANMLECDKFKHFGVAVDGDGDRIALLNGKGDKVNSNMLILLLIHYLCGYKQLKGSVVVSFSVSSSVETLCKHYNIEVKRVKSGVQEISKLKDKSGVILGAEEKGGIILSEFIYERDALWVLLYIKRMLIETQKTIDTLINEIIDITGRLYYKHIELVLSRKSINQIESKCKANEMVSFGGFNVINIENIGGYKFFIDKNTWVLLSRSEREPIINLFVESGSEELLEELALSVQEELFKYVEEFS